MQNIDPRIAQIRDKYLPELQNRIQRLFLSQDAAEQGQLALELLTELPFTILGEFHEAILKPLDPEMDGLGHLAADRQGHVGMSGGAVLSHYDPQAPKTPQERFDYFKGITIVFPCMMTSIHHSWFFEGKPNAKDFKAFMDDYLPKAQARFEPMLEKAYAEDAAALSEVYCTLAAEHPFLLMDSYLAWLDL